MSMKNSSDTIGNRARDLLTCSASLQPIASLRAPPAPALGARGGVWYPQAKTTTYLCILNRFPCSYVVHIKVVDFFNPLNVELNPIRHLLALAGAHYFVYVSRIRVNPLNSELNPIRHLLALAGAHHFVDISRIRVNPLMYTIYLQCGALFYYKCNVLLFTIFFYVRFITRQFVDELKNNKT
jgi:hypothetical protein